MLARLAARSLTIKPPTSKLASSASRGSSSTVKSPSSRRAAMVRANATGAEKLAALRSEMSARELSAFVVPSGDPHFSEYVAACFARRKWLSNFTGSAGTVIVTQDKALLWTDGRYFVQAEAELTEEWTLMRSGTKDVPDVKKWLSTLDPGHTVGIDPNVHSVSEARAFKKALSGVGGTLVSVSENLVDLIWEDRPPFPKTPLRVHGIEFAGQSVSDKLEKIREKMTENKVQHLVVSSLDDVMWLCNVRGGDAPCNPVALSYVLVSETSATFYVDLDKVTDAVRTHLYEANVDIKPYEHMSSDVRNAARRGETLWMDVEHVSIAMLEEAEAGADEAPSIAKVIRTEDATDVSDNKSKGVKEGTSPIPIAKAVKNEAEMAGMVEAHLMDGAAMAELWCWFEQEVAAGRPVDEYSAGVKVIECRAKQRGYIEESFPSIVGEGPHGAIVHYRATIESARSITAESLVLLDSGGQFMCGTTDVTRTAHFGTPTDHQRDCYTRVLQGHIALDQMVFPVGTKGFVLDAFARSHLWANGLDYRHGTGHGVGAALNVHEGPQGISPRYGNLTGLLAGMILSNEPGYYEDGAFGIRIETLLQVVKAETKFNFGDTGYLAFEVLTMIPIQTKLMDMSIMSTKEIKWVNDYHAKVWKNISPRVSGATLKWLENACKPIVK